jgi:hypothetical protein
MEVLILGESHLCLIAPLPEWEVKGMSVSILQRSLDEALTFLRSLRRVLLAVGALAVAVALVMSFLTVA